MELSKKLAELKPTMLNCNAFSIYDYPECYTITELLCEFFKAINGCIEICNKTIDLAEWLVNEGLEIEVAKKLDLWLQDGTLQSIINEKIFNELNDKVDTNKNSIDTLNTEFTNYKQEVTEKFTDTNNKIGLIKQNLDSVYVFSDDYPTLQQAHDAVVAKGGGTLIINKDYELIVSFMWDCSKVIIDGKGHYLKAIKTGVNLVNVVSSENKGKPYYQSQISFSNLRLIGNKIDVGFWLSIDDADMALSHITIRNCSIENTNIAINLHNSAYLIKFIDCDIYNNKEIFRISSNSIDSGENIQFRGCAIYNNTGGFNVKNGNCDIFLNNCSIDYNEVGSIFDIDNAKVYLNSCHLEHNAKGIFTTTVPFVVKGDAGQLFIDNSLIMFSNPSETTMANIFYTTGGNSCISVSNTFMFGCMTTSGYLCGGNGNLHLNNVKVNIVPMCSLAIHPSVTTSAIGSMESDKLVDIWITEDTTTINGIQTSGQNGNITVDTSVSLKFGRSIKIQKIGGGGSPFSVRTIFPIDKQSINNVRIALKKLSGSGTVYIDFGYCVSQNGIDYTVSKGTETKVYGENVTEWETIEKTMMTSPLWATHGYINIATGGANAIQLNIGEIVSNSI